MHLDSSEVQGRLRAEARLRPPVLKAFRSHPVRQRVSFQAVQQFNVSAHCCCGDLDSDSLAFETTLQVDQVIMLEDMRLTLNEIRDTQTSGVSPIIMSVLP